MTPFFDLTAEETDEVVALNFTGTILCMQLAAQMIREHPIDNSCIIVVSSIRGLGAVPGRLIYAATKAGVNQAARVAAAELAPLGIRVNILSPGHHRDAVDGAEPGSVRRDDGDSANGPCRSAHRPGRSGLLLVLTRRSVHHRLEHDRRRRRVAALTRRQVAFFVTAFFGADVLDTTFLDAAF